MRFRVESAEEKKQKTFVDAVAVLIGSACLLLDQFTCLFRELWKCLIA